MHIKALAVFLFIGLAVADKQFSHFQNKFNKKYSPKELLKRQAIFQANVKAITEHNEKFARGETSYQKQIDEFTDMTREEMAAHINGLPPVPENAKTDAFSEQHRMSLKRSRKVPLDSFSWVDQGVVTSVKNQGGCGSCTAFAVTGSLEACFNIKNGVGSIDDLSEQFLVDCGYGYSVDGFGAYGCDGAWPRAYYGYLKDQSSGRDQTEAYYPYTATYSGYCGARDDGYYLDGAMTDYVTYWGTNEDELMDLLVNHGPVATTIDATCLGGYYGGVIDDWQCCDQVSDMNCV